MAVIFIHININKVMECFEFGFNIVGDVDGKLRKTVEYVAGANKRKAIVLAGYINSQEFLDYCKQDDKFDSTKSIADNPQNTVRRILRKYFREKHKSVIESAAKAQAESLQGFSNVNAKNIAIDYTATLVNINYYTELRKSKDTNIKLDRKKIINQTLLDIENNFIRECAIPIYKIISADTTIKNREELEDFKNGNNEYLDIRDKIKQLNTTKHKIDIKEYNK